VVNQGDALIHIGVEGAGLNGWTRPFIEIS